jgi:hypothetical protein
MNPVKIVKEHMGMREGNSRVIEGWMWSKYIFMHVWKYHNETPHFVQLTCGNKEDTLYQKRKGNLCPMISWLWN